MSTEVTVFVCPRCQQRAVRAPNTGDFEHTCFGDPTLQNESVFVIGNWVDYTGSDLHVQNALMQGRENILFGTRAALEGQKEDSRDLRGYPEDRYRSRQHIESIPAEQLKGPGLLPDQNIEGYDD